MCTAMLQTGQRRLLKWQSQASQAHTSGDQDGKSTAMESHRPGDVNRPRQSMKGHNHALHIAVYFGRGLMRMMRIWMAVHLVIFRMFVTAQAGGVSTVQSSESYERLDMTAPHGIGLPLKPAEAKQSRLKFQLDTDYPESKQFHVSRGACVAVFY